MTIKFNTKLHGRNGFTLIEVLVALLIMAVGMLGVAVLQFKGLQYNHDAYVRTQINFLAYDMADRIRLNSANAASYEGDYEVPTTLPTGCIHATAADATNDLACWRQQLFRAVPPGSTANITEDNGLYTIALGWTDKGNDTHNVTFTFQP